MRYADCAVSSAEGPYIPGTDVSSKSKTDAEVATMVDHVAHHTGAQYGQTGHADGGNCRGEMIVGRPGGRFRRPGVADRFRPARRSQRPHPAHHLVGGHFHDHLHQPYGSVRSLRQFALRARQLQARADLSASQVRQVRPGFYPPQASFPLPRSEETNGRPPTACRFFVGRTVG